MRWTLRGGVAPLALLHRGFPPETTPPLPSRAGPTPSRPRLAEILTRSATGNPEPLIPGRARRSPSRVPSRPRKPAALQARQLQAARLRRPRDPRLPFSLLHRGHPHPELDRVLAEVDPYLGQRSPLPDMRWISPWDRSVILYELQLRRRRTPSHKWGRLWRIADLERAAGLEE